MEVRPGSGAVLLESCKITEQYLHTSKKLLPTGHSKAGFYEVNLSASKDTTPFEIMLFRQGPQKQSLVSPLVLGIQSAVGF
jgi:hypothetical protein